MAKIQTLVNTLRSRQNGRHFADDIFKCIFLNENVSISIKISLKFVRKGPMDNIPALVQIMAWRRLGDKPLYEPMLVSLLTHTCVTRPQCSKKEDYHAYGVHQNRKREIEGEMRMITPYRLTPGPSFNTKAIFPGMVTSIIKIRQN